MARIDTKIERVNACTAWIVCFATNGGNYSTVEKKKYWAWKGERIKNYECLHTLDPSSTKWATDFFSGDVFNLRPYHQWPIFVLCCCAHSIMYEMCLFSFSISSIYLIRFQFRRYVGLIFACSRFLCANVDAQSFSSHHIHIMHITKLFIDIVQKEATEKKTKKFFFV